MFIRKATSKDLTKLKQIKTEFFVSEARMDALLNPSWTKKGLVQELRKQLSNKNVIYYIAEDKNDIVGYAAAQIDKPGQKTIPTKRGHLFNLYVKNPYRNQGLGQKLTDMTLKWLKQKNVKWVQLFVYSKNPSAYKFYKRFGFRDHMLEMEKTIR